MRLLDLFAGVGGERRRPQIEARGHELVTLDYDASFHCNVTADIFTVIPTELGRFDFVWASPPCECFSVASIGHHWYDCGRGAMPKTEEAVKAQELVRVTLALIAAINPSCGWLLENPRGMMRRLACLQPVPRVTVTYCQYGETRMKPTDLWGTVPGWTPRPPCKNGDPCHERAPRGARTGTQGIKGAAERAVVPWQLWEEILTALERR